MRKKYIVITPAKNEEEYIPKVIESMIKQTILPVRWVIIDDNSDDNTAEILKKAISNHKWIRLLQSFSDENRAPGAKVVHTFNFGLSTIDEEYDYIVKFDADLEFEADYFERILVEFDLHPKLGIAGGYCVEKYKNKLKIEPTPTYHVRGATKVYRSECFEDIGGLIPAMGWDGLDEMKAQMLGWETRSIKDISLIHLRPTGKASGSLRYAWLWGKSSYFMGYDPLFFIIRSLKNIYKKPYILFSFTMLISYIFSLISK